MAVRVIIVGAGAAGIYSAYRLRKTLGSTAEIVLLEQSARVGGNAMATPIDGVNLECGAQFFHRGAQSSFMALLDALELWGTCEMVRTAAGFTIWDRARSLRVLHLPATLAGFGSLGLGDWVRTTKFGLFIAYCYALERWETDWTVTVDAWLGRMRLLDDAFKHEVIKPFLFQFVTLPSHRIGEASAKYAVTYLVRTMFPGAGVRPDVPRLGHGRPTFEAYQSLLGLHEVHQRVLAAAEVRATLRTRVLAIQPRSATGESPGRVTVVTPEGTLTADHVVVATDPHVVATALVAGGAAEPALITCLQALEYARLPISMQHGLPGHMPDRRADWQPFNTIVDGDALMFSVWFGPMRRPAADGSLVHAFKSWGSPRLQPSAPPSEFLAHEHFIPLPTASFMRTREQLMNCWQGHGGVWFAGGWTRWFDSQEAALQSADVVALGIASRVREQAMGTDLRAPVVEFLDRCSNHAPVELRGALAHALDEVEARG